MKRLTMHIIYLFLLFAAAMGFVSCSDAEEDVHGGGKEDFGTYLEVRIRVKGDGSKAVTRAVGPNGGETGDVTEVGNDNENNVKNATLLLYRDGKGINADKDTKIEFALYAPVMKPDGTAYTSGLLKYKTTLPRGEYHAIVLVNMGDQTGLEGRTLGEVRDMKMPVPCDLQYDAATGLPNKNVTAANNFAMTSAGDVEFVLGDMYGIDNPVLVELNVERMSARIDFSPGRLAADGDDESKTQAKEIKNEKITLDDDTEMTLPVGYRYVVLNASTKEPTDDRFILTEVTPFNCLTSGTYYIKRVADDPKAGKEDYLGKETVDGDKNGVNCVVDPWTKGKDDPEQDPDGLGYRNRLKSASIEEWKGTETKLWWVREKSELLPPKAVPDKYKDELKDINYYILDYTQENTLLPGHGKERYATGLLISGYYGKLEGGVMKYTRQHYYYYIRHADPNGSGNESLPMKYGIVRNNIYRIHINSVNSIGHIQIVVSEWNRLEVPEIQL